MPVVAVVVLQAAAVGSDRRGISHAVHRPFHAVVVVQLEAGTVADHQAAREGDRATRPLD